jgi:hypothetical protein
MRKLVIVFLFLVVAPVQAQRTGDLVTPTAPRTPTPTPQTDDELLNTVLTRTARTARTPAKEATTAPPNTAATPVAATVANPAAFSPAKSEPISVPFLEKAPQVDGKLGDGEWQAAMKLGDFLQVKPGDNLPPSHPTEVLLGYDAKFLYIAFRAHDDPKRVRATVAKRDAITKDDLVGLILDTFNDKRRAYVFGFNPLGVQQDAIYSEGKGADYSVDVVMNSIGALDEQGYVVEVAIPFKSLRYKAGEGSRWGVHFFREVRRLNNEINSWMPISRDKSSILMQAGQITGLDQIATERNLEIIPSLTISESGKRIRTIPPAIARADPTLRDDGRFLNEPIGLDPGVTLKYGLTPTVTLDFAYNPDFAQVEADATVVTANQRFPIFFEEKRPFFLEGIEIFRTPLNAVHTRAIVDPDLAVKLTGKLGDNSFGVLLASDNAPGNFSPEDRDDPDILPRIQKFLDKNAYIGVLRFKRDIGQENNIGFIATSYNFIEKHNDLAGIDGRFRLSENMILDFQVLGTTSRRFFFDPDLGRSIYRTGNAFGYSYNLAKSGRKLVYELRGEGRTRDYVADVGFTRRTDTNNHTFFIRYASEPNPKAKLISWRLANSTSTNFDWRSRMQGWDDSLTLTLNFQRQTSIGIGAIGGYERIFESEFGANRTPTRPGAFAGDDPERSTYEKTLFVSAETSPSQKYSASILLGHVWGTFDYDLGSRPRFQRISPPALLDPRAQLDPGPGNSLQLKANLTLQPTSALRTSLTYTKVNLVREDTRRLAFDDNIYSWRALYQFTRFTFARARLDYSTLSTKLRGQYLIGWSPNPGTAFYVGYNDDLNHGGYNPFTGHFEPGFRRNNRTFYIKMSYLFRRTF